jgi:protein-L-isoaspartate(D-aspartate) O-methyltransferase
MTESRRNTLDSKLALPILNLKTMAEKEVKIGERPNRTGFVLILIICLAPFVGSPTQTARLELRAAEIQDAFARQRMAMVARDLRGRGIRDERVLAAMGAIPRHLFVPERQRASAYDDRPLSIGEGQTISQPYIVALMTELLELRSIEKVLEIGTGSGYQTTVLARLASEVFSIEIRPALSERARKIIDDLGQKNVWLKIGDGFYGWEERGPFDAILVTAAASKIPEPLSRQLREGGRLVMPLTEGEQNQRLIRARKSAGKLTIEDFSAVLFVPLTGAIEKRGR